MENRETRQALSIRNQQERLGRWADGKLEVHPHGVHLSADSVSVMVKCVECNARFTDVLGDDAGYLGYLHWNEKHKN